MRQAYAESIRAKHLSKKFKGMMKVHRILFLSLGLERAYPPRDRKHAQKTTDKLLEPDGARVCRRNILALAGVVVLAGAAGTDPRDLIAFGVKPADDWGMLVLGLTAILAQVYWYVLRYYHLRDDGKIEQNPAESGTGTKYLKINWNNFRLVRRGADLLSNWAAFVLTGLSWCFIGSWIVGGAAQ